MRLKGKVRAINSHDIINMALANFADVVDDQSRHLSSVRLFCMSALVCS